MSSNTSIVPETDEAVGSTGSETAKRGHEAGGVLDRVKAHFAEQQGLVPLNQIITFVTKAYLADLDPGDAPGPAVIEAQLLTIANAVIRAENAKTGDRDLKLPMAKTLNAWQVAQILIRLHNVVRISPAGESNVDQEYDPIAMYQSRGPGRGTYTASEDDIRKKARGYNAQLILRDFNEVLAVLKEDCRRTTTCQHRDLIAVGNGIFHYGTEPLDIAIGGKEFHFEPKSLHPFDPALVFLVKSKVDYRDDAAPVFIENPDGTVWDLESWVAELSDDEGVPELLWEIAGAIIRPHVSWNKSAWFYSERGNNGKGTACSLLRNLVGAGSHTSIPLSDFGKNFALEPLIKSTAIIVDENDVGEYIDKAANLKAVVTGDVIQIDRKYRMPLAYRFEGFMVQCLNGFPRVKDKSESFYRRQLFVPFSKWFGGEAERRYIKDDYLKRPEVLEYALWYVLHKAGGGAYYELSEPEATEIVLAEYKEANDPVRAFWGEFRERLAWDLVPFTFAYDLYKAWFADVSPTGSPVGRQQFIADLIEIVRADPEWHFPGKDKTGKVKETRIGRHMNATEPLIAEYDLKAWKRSVRDKYRGILRSTPRSNTAVAQATDAPSAPPTAAAGIKYRGDDDIDAPADNDAPTT
ncbi:DNA primase family protein [Rothia halotolerans]|uniref:DNA primase family protein n=1 Tax=Rothia halotolerans TaxID=405770 RepID=UPI00101C887A|nr:phage/plasmid primase, P4 family [Rothia halotolerans]